jgi:hypothetical protein
MFFPVACDFTPVGLDHDTAVSILCDHFMCYDCLHAQTSILSVCLVIQLFFKIEVDKLLLPSL